MIDRERTESERDGKPVPEADRAARIFRAAAAIIHEKGFHATSINDIAESVQLTKAGLYYYIKGKEDLLFAIMSFGMDQLENIVVEPARRQGSARARLRTIVAQHARLVTGDNSAITILVNEIEGLSHEHRRDIVRRQRSYFEFIRDTLKELRQQGLLADIDPTVAAFGLLGMVLWISRWYRPQGRLTAEEVVDQITRIAMGGLLRSETEVRT